MINRIICPTDFSPIANNAVEYAAMLGKTLNAGLLLLHVEQLPVNIPLMVSGAILDENMSESMSQLRSLSQDVCKTFQIPCSYHVSVARQDISSAIAGQSEEHSLIVMGTNGIEDIYTYFFGNNAYHVAKKVHHPALVIPANARFEGIRKMTLAMNDLSKIKPICNPLSLFIRTFHPEMDLLHVSASHLEHKEQPSETEAVSFTNLKTELREELGEYLKFELKQAYSDDVAGAIAEHVIESGADLLAITMHNQGLLSTITGHAVAKELLGTAEFPILVFPV